MQPIHVYFTSPSSAPPFSPISFSTPSLFTDFFFSLPNNPTKFQANSVGIHVFQARHSALASLALSLLTPRFVLPNLSWTAPRKKNRFAIFLFNNAKNFHFRRKTGRNFYLILRRQLCRISERNYNSQHA